MSLIRRRKSPGWGLGFTSKAKERAPIRKKVGGSIVKKILNPLSERKINLGGPKHKQLIEEGILDANGVDIRSKKPLKRTPKKAVKRITKPKSTPRKSTPKSTTINTENLLINYSIKDGRLTYELLDVIDRTKEIVESRASGKDKQLGVAKVFADFRYNNDSEIKKKVDSLFLKIPYGDLLKDLTDIYNFDPNKKSRLSDKHRKKLEQEYRLRRKSVVIGIELGELFADLRYQKNEQAKFEIINKILSLTESPTESPVKPSDKTEQSAFVFISSAIRSEAQDANLLFNYYFNQKIPLVGDYIFKNDYEIINKMIEREEDVFLIYLVFANLEKLKEKDLGLLNRLTRYLTNSPKKSTEQAGYHLNDIKKATDHSVIREIDVMTFVRNEAIKMGRKEKVAMYVGSKSNTDEYLEKLKKNKPKVYEKLLKEYVIDYDPTKDTIATFLEKMKKSNIFLRNEDYNYYPKYTTYPYLKSVKMKKTENWYEWIPGMLVPDDRKRKMVINQMVDYYEKKYEIDEVEALEYLKEDFGEHKPDETLRHVQSEIKKYPKHYKTFISKLNKDLAFLDSRIKNMEMFKPGAVGYLKTKQDFEKKQEQE